MGFVLAEEIRRQGFAGQLASSSTIKIAPRENLPIVLTA
jgi:hypothetical protein